MKYSIKKPAPRSYRYQFADLVYPIVLVKDFIINDSILSFLHQLLDHMYDYKLTSHYNRKRQTMVRRVDEIKL